MCASKALDRKKYPLTSDISDFQNQEGLKDWQLLVRDIFIS